MGIMGYGGHKYPQLEDATLERVNAMRAARKLGPLDKNVWRTGRSKQRLAEWGLVFESAARATARASTAAPTASRRRRWRRAGREVAGAW